MNDQKRDELRALQTEVYTLACDRGVNLSLQCSAEYPGSPALRDLGGFLYPEWESAIRIALNELQRERG